jgi:hypothetical protein
LIEELIILLLVHPAERVIPPGSRACGGAQKKLVAVHF